MRLPIKLIILVFGLLFLFLGAAIGIFGARSAAAEADRAEALAALSAAALEDAPTGATALVEGTLSPRNPALFQEYVAYTIEEYRGEDDGNGDPKWERDGQVSPPLLVEAAGIVRVANDDYRIQGFLTRSQDSTALTWNGLTGEGTRRYAGLVAGQPVTAIGAVVAGAEGNELSAEVVFGGTQAEYVASQRQSAFFMPIVGAIFGAIGLVVAGVAGWLLVRR